MKKTMKKTMKKAMALIIATLMLALATPFSMMTVAADEATPVDIAVVNLDVYGRHADDGNTMLFFNPDCPAVNAFDGDISTEAQSKNGNKRPYEMCYFNADGVMTYGANPTAGGKSYYGIFIVELEGKSVVDTLSLWTPTKANGTGYLYEVGWMGNDAYDIYYSEDGTSYTAVDGASYSGVVEKQSSQSPLYVAGTYNQKTGYVHEIDMKDVTAEYIAIAVSAYVPDSTNAEYREMIFYEMVVKGALVEDELQDNENNQNNQNNQNNGSQSSQNKTEDTKSATDTKADTTAATETEVAEEKGCGGVIGGVGVALVGAFAAGVALKSKKKENN